ncbi:MAG TPA: class I SAM-dependent methyltransferase [Acidobacteriota bacterium]|nr:class I SAM-dependent methyltransferase [Acidobacteriota bacterium]HRV08999.1 class I SAM-dependent methyltransferase [Acidobacteriota bacterium]
METGNREPLPVRAVCPLCRSVRSREEFTKGKYFYYRCAACLHVFVDPLPTAEEEEAHYRSSYTSSYLAEVREWFTILARRRMDLLESVWSGDRKGAILDAGCGYGFFLHEALTRGWTCYGVEAADGPARFAKDEFSLDVLLGDLPDRLTEFEDESLSVITFWHVLEHVAQPGLLLRAATSKLQPNGLLVINSPNLDSAIYKLAGKHWNWIHTPGHLQYFSTASVESFLGRLGLKTITAQTWTDAPNLFFLLEEAALHRLCDVASKFRWPSVVPRFSSRLRGSLYRPFHQQRIQAFWNEIYKRVPKLDSYLRRNCLGHEFVVIARK